MTFEEFFTKKRINLELMAEADPTLYTEFKSHFNLMGEKSFDHSKKFWFNKLRHLYHLAIVPKDKPVVIEPNLAAQAEPLQSPTIEITQPVAKPGFKPRHLKAPSLISDEVKDPDARPGTNAVTDPFAAAISKIDEAEGSIEVKKPAFKPRFSSKVVVKPAVEEVAPVADLTQKNFPETRLQEIDLPEAEKLADEEKKDIPKPTYKPRFSAKVIAKPPVEEIVPSADLTEKNYLRLICLMRKSLLRKKRKRFLNQHINQDLVLKLSQSLL
ncbi:hypothetical protein ADIARSV_3649 [Arcticibacter svalbardensis MN12-7]|uniref:Uncharacterized protein n=1 Tax=Arcticibacter svalbardensis MN12-7 TaxID=1150600 RepID=R9GNY5_9SPHI|nr:hypothetical protein [Arcticibacter svalbardensis]EOR93230.1 hypothetical protein ADIARSV_3649 [Arcticibacter svalbardensis MN12-7]